MQKTFVFLSAKTIYNDSQLVSIGACTSTGKNAYLFNSDTVTSNNESEKWIMEYKNIPPPLNVDEEEFVSGSFYNMDNYFGSYPTAEFDAGLKKLAQWILSFGPLTEIWLEEITEGNIQHIRKLQAYIQDHINALPPEHPIHIAKLTEHQWNSLKPVLEMKKVNVFSDITEYVGDRIGALQVVFSPFPNEQDVYAYPDSLISAWQMSHQALYSAIILREAFAKTFGIPFQLEAKNPAEKQEIPVSPTNPAYYRDGAYEMIDLIEDQGLDYLLGNAVRIIYKANKTAGSGQKIIDSLNKACWYIDRCIGRCEQGKWKPQSSVPEISVENFCSTSNLSEWQSKAIQLICSFNAVQGKDYMHFTHLLDKAKISLMAWADKLANPETKSAEA